MSVAYTSSRPSNFRYIPDCRCGLRRLPRAACLGHWLTCMRIDRCAWCAAGAQCCVHCKQRSRNLERALLVRRLETQPYSKLAQKPVLILCRSAVGQHRYFNQVSNKDATRPRRKCVSKGRGVHWVCGLGKPYSSSHSLDHYILVRVNGHCALLLQRGRHHHRMPFALQMDTPAQHGACMNIVKGQHEVTATRS